MPEPARVLFVCLGNICRSPTAEGVLRARLAERGLEHAVEVDSAGTTGYHAGERADSRMRQHARNRGYDLTSRARQIEVADFGRFDLIVAMDGDNLRDIRALAPSPAAAERVQRFCSFVPDCDTLDVPDPYYGGAAGFERVLDLIEAGCDAIIDALVESGAQRGR